MTIYYKSSNPCATIFKAKDKYENEKCLKYAFPHDVWFHVKGSKAAPHYLRMEKPIQSLSQIPPRVIEECAQLTKDSSAEASKIKNAVVVYTWVSNLAKNNDMAVGTVYFKNMREVREVGIDKSNKILRTLKNNKEEKNPDYYKEREIFLGQHIKYQKGMQERNEKEEILRREQDRRRKIEMKKNTLNKWEQYQVDNQHLLQSNQDNSDSEFWGENTTTTNFYPVAKHQINQSEQMQFDDCFDEAQDFQNFHNDASPLQESSLAHSGNLSEGIQKRSQQPINYQEVIEDQLRSSNPDKMKDHILQGINQQTDVQKQRKLKGQQKIGADWEWYHHRNDHLLQNNQEMQDYDFWGESTTQEQPAIAQYEFNESERLYLDESFDQSKEIKPVHKGAPPLKEFFFENNGNPPVEQEKEPEQPQEYEELSQAQLTLMKENREKGVIMFSVSAFCMIFKQYLNDLFQI